MSSSVPLANATNSNASELASPRGPTLADTCGGFASWSWPSWADAEPIVAIRTAVPTAAANGKRMGESSADERNRDSPRPQESCGVRSANEGSGEESWRDAQAVRIEAGV